MIRTMIRITYGNVSQEKMRMGSDLDEYVEQYIKENDIEITEEMKLVIRKGLSMSPEEGEARIAKLKEKLRNL